MAVGIEREDALAIDLDHEDERQFDENLSQMWPGINRPQCPTTSFSLAAVSGTSRLLKLPDGRWCGSGRRSEENACRANVLTRDGARRIAQPTAGPGPDDGAGRSGDGSESRRTNLALSHTSTSCPFRNSRAVAIAC
jgi:hypothetical protein